MRAPKPGSGPAWRVLAPQFLRLYLEVDQLGEGWLRDESLMKEAADEGLHLLNTVPTFINEYKVDSSC
jgi:hypothetical protein